MPKRKRGVEKIMQERGLVVSWLFDDSSGKSKGFGFVENEGGQRIFCHKSVIKDGNALQPGTEVCFDTIDNERKPGEMKAVNVSGGVCYDHVFLKCCRAKGRCKFSHAERPQAARKEPTLDEAVAAVVAGRAGGAAPILVDTVERCKQECDRLSRAGAVAVDFEGVNLCRDGELLLAQLAAPDGPVVLVDVYTLGAEAFDAGGLRALLESRHVLKLIFDGRSDSDALFHLYGCKLQHVCDCQVLCALHIDEQRHARGQSASTRLPGLSSALSSCPALAVSGSGKQLAQLKKAVQPLFVPEVREAARRSKRRAPIRAAHTTHHTPAHADACGLRRAFLVAWPAQLGGSYENWRARPLSEALLEYAAADVAHLHTLRAAWSHLIAEDEMSRITAARIEKATGGEGRAKGPHMAERDF